MAGDSGKGAWGVRGVPKELREAVAKRAEGEGRKVGALVAEALAAWLERPTAPELADRVTGLERGLAELQRRIGTPAASGARQATPQPVRRAGPERPAPKAGGSSARQVPPEDRAEMVRLAGELSHAKIAERLKWSKPTVTKVIKQERERAQQRAAAEPGG